MSMEKFGTPRTQSKKFGEQEVLQGLKDLEDEKKGGVGGREGTEGAEESKRNPSQRHFHSLEESEERERNPWGVDLENIPNELILTTQLFERQGIELTEIWDWYQKAISRRDREPLPEDRFEGHFSGLSTDPTFAFGDKEKGFLLGFLKYGVFVPTHFAPKTMRGGYELMKELGRGKIPAVMSITPDLSETLKKMPEWEIADLSFLSGFHTGETMEKNIAFNSHPDVRNLALGLLNDYLAEQKNHEQDSGGVGQEEKPEDSETSPVEQF